MSVLLIATQRGIWRCGYQPQATLREEDFHVDAPSCEIRSLSGHRDAALALTDDERLLVWEPRSRIFREEELVLGELSGPESDESEPEACHLAPSGARYLLGCPAELWRSLPGSPWEAVLGLRELAGSQDWKGLESPYEPRVSAVLERPRTGLEARGRADAGGDADLYAAISVGGLVLRRAGAWSAVAPGELPRDLRTLAWAHDRLWIGGGQGLGRLDPGGSAHEELEALGYRRASLPPAASFVSRILALPQGGLVIAAAGGPPATWRGPDGARMSLWHFADAEGVGRPIAGPLHGVVTGLAFDGQSVVAVTEDGELWRVPLEGPAPDAPLLDDLPRAYGLFLVEGEEMGG